MKKKRIYYRKYVSNPANRLKLTARTHKRRALKQQCHTAPYTKADLQNLKDKFNHSCAYCGSDSKLEIDHFISLASGGADCLGNFVIACKRCNASKSDNDPLDWYEKQPFYSKKRWQIILKLLGKDKAYHRQLPLF